MCTEKQRKFASSGIVTARDEAIKHNTENRKSCPNRYNTIKDICERLESNIIDNAGFSELSFD